ncbi:hypothetical protein FA15DRAFT_703697 [Coprinopsis marcescibilis]|uniref:Uncharacterized protein n=1 Tax=Coprinopsis marcescibilis TaxID=230819 RepID=A0A5C3KXZ6_COPMA|nr:hypothetical protein FA15DRAFT_703697 [Coprinopsis marcescibilis]
MSTFQTIQVGPGGTQLAYADSGVPSSTSYTTVFIIHGTIFHTIVDLATGASLRIVVVNGRDYPGSTPLSVDPNQITGASKDEKAGYLRDRGMEILRFVDLFIQANDVPEVSEDGKSGGVAVLGWALGAGVTLASLSHASELDKDVSERLSRYIRAHILLDPPTHVIGQPTPPEFWIPLGDEFIQEPDRLPANHAHVDPASTASDGLLYSKALAAQLEANYRKACFDSEVRSIFPHSKVIEVARDMAPAVGVIAFWKIQDDDAVHGGGHVAFDVIRGANHFAQWDCPDKVIDSIRRAVGA